MSAISFMEENLGPVGGAVTTMVGEGALGFVTGVGLGELYVRHNDKWIGRNASWVALAVGKGLSALIQVMSGGDPGSFWSSTSGLLDVVGQSGATASGLEVGLDHARKTAVAALPPKTAVGALPPAAAGRALNWAQLEEIAQMS